MLKEIWDLIICLNFSRGHAFGKYCNDLCVDKSVKINQCIHHSTTYVLVGSSKGEDIVMKMKKPSDMFYTIKYFEESITQDSSISNVRNAYLDRLEDHVRSKLGIDSLYLFRKNIDVMSRHIFHKNISELTLPEMRASWNAIGQDELLMTLLHQRLETFSKYIGICGPLYIIERTRPFSDFFPEIIPTLSWYKRVAIAKGFLYLLKEFQRTDIGPLYHCDIQEGNFGLTKKYTVKAIDVDLIYGSEKMVELLTGASCTSDKDCDFFDCISKCDVVTRRCTSKSLTNNLQVMCRDIFLPQWPSTGLLSYYQPSHVKEKLNSLLESCRSKGFGSLLMTNDKVVKMMKDLENVLDISLRTVTAF